MWISAVREKLDALIQVADGETRTRLLGPGNGGKRAFGAWPDSIRSSVNAGLNKGEAKNALAWAVTGSQWIPLLLSVGFWRHAVEKMPIAYDPQYWSLVFPIENVRRARVYVEQGSAPPLSC